MYNRIDHIHDKKTKPMILDWLASTVGTEFQHSYSDQWIVWSIWNGNLDISLDFRQTTHRELFEKLPNANKGCLSWEGKLVNTKTLYYKVSNLTKVDYPDIVRHRLIRHIRHKDDDGDTFYVYEWEVFLSDGSSLFYSNQDKCMDMVKSNFSYRCTIEQRAFINFLNKQIK